MNFLRALDGTLVNLADVVLIRPFDKESDGDRWEELCSEHDLQWIKTREVAVLLLRHEPGDEQFSKRGAFFIHEDDAADIHAAFVPASPGWSVVRVDTASAAEPVIGWAMPSGLPVIANLGVVRLGPVFSLVAPDGTRTRRVSEWKSDPNTGKLVEFRWETPA